MIVIAYQDESKTWRVLAEYDDDAYDTAKQTAEDYFTNAGGLVGLELLLTEIDGDFATSVCLNSWTEVQPNSLAEHPPESSTATSPAVLRWRKLSLWLAGGMGLVVMMAIVRAITH